VLDVVAAIGGAVGLVVLIASEGGRAFLDDVGSWLYPEWVIALLGLLLGVLSVRLMAVRRRLARHERNAAVLNREQRERDRRRANDLISMVPRATITQLREHDFGGSWNDDELSCLTRFVYERDAVEHCFADPELEGLRAQLLNSIRSFRAEVALRSAPIPSGRQSIKEWGDTGVDPEQRARYDENRAVLNRGADQVAAAYDALLKRAAQAALLD
jgi:hypothetical protein